MNRVVRPTTAPAPTPTPPIGATMFAAIRPGPADRVGVAWIATAVVHLLLLGWAWTVEPTLEAWSAELALLVHAELNREVLVDAPEAPPQAAEPQAPAPPPAAEPPPTAEPAPQPPPPTAEPPPAAAPPRQGRHLTAAPERPAAPPPAAAPATPPAQAGRVVTQEGEPVDFSGDGFVQGDGPAYVGGATTADGQGQVPGSRPEPPAARDRPPAPSPSPAPASRARDLSRPVGLGGGEWRCPWPSEADAAQIDEQSVLVKVLVDVDGSVVDVRVQADPGFGFAAAAVTCARGATMLSALDASGQPTRAWSPAIRVRFRR